MLLFGVSAITSTRWPVRGYSLRPLVDGRWRSGSRLAASCFRLSTYCGLALQIHIRRGWKNRSSRTCKSFRREEEEERRASLQTSLLPEASRVSGPHTLRSHTVTHAARILALPHARRLRPGHLNPFPARRFGCATPWPSETRPAAAHAAPEVPW